MDNEESFNDQPQNDAMIREDQDDSSSESDSDSDSDIEEETGAAISYQLLALAPLGQDDPNRMKLTREELDWAEELKGVVDSMPDIDSLSDFMYAQYALVTEGDVSDAVRRMIWLQDFMEEYKVLDTVQASHRGLRRLLELFPGHFLSSQFDEEGGTYIQAYDMEKFDTKLLTTPDKVDTFFAGCYYLHNAMAPDLDTIRRGTLGLMECRRTSWSQRQDYKIIAEVYRQLLSVYPAQNRVRFFHTGVVFNALISFMKRDMPPKDRGMMEVGCSAIGGLGLEEIFSVPTLEEAQERTLKNLQAAIDKRAANEKSFSLQSALYRGQA